MTKNLENLKLLLLKHLEKEQREKGIIMSIFERINKDVKDEKAANNVSMVKSSSIIVNGESNALRNRT